MGSLPNLHEIGKEENNSNNRNGLYFGQGNSLREPFSKVRSGKTKIRYRQSERGDLPRPRRKMPPSTKWIPFDDFIVQTATSSPSSTQGANIVNGVRRKDSLSSSIGTASIRKLISVTRNSHVRPKPRYSRKCLIRYLILFCVSHLFFNITFLPFIVLQGSASTWVLPFNVLPIGVNTGPFLLALMYFTAMLSTLFSPYIVKKFGPQIILTVSYGTFTLFYAVHLYPAIYLLLPSYILLGLALGQTQLCYLTVLMCVSSKISYTLSNYDEELRLPRCSVLIRRFARVIQASQDVGLIFGSLLTAIAIGYWQQQQSNSVKIPCEKNLNSSNCSNCTQLNSCIGCSNGAIGKNCDEISAIQNYNIFLDNFFNIDEHGYRICGASACVSNYVIHSNNSYSFNVPMLSSVTTILLPATYCGFTLLALVISIVGLRKLQNYVNQDTMDCSNFFMTLRAIKDSFKDVKLQLAIPLSLFIGMEQAFIYSDFSKSYIICTLGIQHVNWVFLSMGLLQAVASSTLSMLLKSIQRYHVVAVGFVFQCCVLMVKILWKPMSDDPALFYVIPAVWGVCNAIWEILLFSLLTTLYTENCSAPFCILTLFRFLGLALSFVLHGLLCNMIKLYILAIFMLFAVVSFFSLEVSLSKSQKNPNSNL